MQSFCYHGFTEFHLEGKWVRCTPAFNRELCLRHKVAPLEFDGREDSIFQAYNMEKKKFMEYVTYHGTYADIPLEVIMAAWEETYGKDRVQVWINALEEAGDKPIADFLKEDVLD